jgi:uncharacterized protein YbjT (DUF2867 family)
LFASSATLSSSITVEEKQMDIGKTIVVTGATGRQGQAVCHSLLAGGFNVVAVARDPTSETAHRLSAQGAHLKQGDLDDGARLAEIFQGAFGVFSMQNFWEAGYVREFEQALNVLDAARRSGVPHLVYSSAGLDSGCGLPHIETKCCIEALTQRYFPTAVILRGAWFMEGFLEGFVDIERGEFRFVTEPYQPHGWVCMEDIGRFVVHAFREPQTYAGAKVNLVSGFSTGLDMAEAFARALGRPVTYRKMGAEEVQAMIGDFISDPVFARELSGVFRVLHDVNFTVDSTLLARLLPNPTSLDRWVQDVWLPRQAHRLSVPA